MGGLARGLSKQISGSAATLDERAAAGFVRRCHGDLHLANIVMWEGRPALYDAIEFDEAVATIDTLYDLAFLLMDLDRHNQRPAANIVLNRYLWQSGMPLDLQGLIAMPLFLALRAAIRAMVTADRAAQEDREGRETDLEKARHYLRAALGYLEVAPPQLVAVGGLSGTGKTTLAASLAPWLGRAPGAIHLRTDLERKRLAGVGELDRLPESAYSQEARKRIYDVLHEKARFGSGNGPFGDCRRGVRRTGRASSHPGARKRRRRTLSRYLAACRPGKAPGTRRSKAKRCIGRHPGSRSRATPIRSWAIFGSMDGCRRWRDTG